MGVRKNLTSKEYSPAGGKLNDTGILSQEFGTGCIVEIICRTDAKSNLTSPILTFIHPASNHMQGYQTSRQPGQGGSRWSADCSNTRPIRLHGPAHDVNEIAGQESGKEQWKEPYVTRSLRV